jgi:hypothetical protein
MSSPKIKVYEEIALICAKKIKAWSQPGAASCAHDEAVYSVKRELKEIKDFCNKRIIVLSTNKEVK